MQLVLATDQNTVVVLDDFETFLNPQRGVGLNQISVVLKAIRESAAALTPVALSPSELDASYPLLSELAQHAKNLANAAPPLSPDAQAVLSILRDLRLATV